MKTLFILMNHALTPEQEEDARKNLYVGKFVNIPIQSGAILTRLKKA